MVNDATAVVRILEKPVFPVLTIGVEAGKSYGRGYAQKLAETAG